MVGAGGNIAVHYNRDVKPNHSLFGRSTCYVVDVGQHAAPEETRSWMFAVVVVVAATVFAVLLRSHLTPVNLAMIYLLEVVAVSARSSRKVSIATALASVAAFDFFCVPPYLTFAIVDPEYLVTFAARASLAVASPA